jgi:hypothetical protein
VVREKDIRPAGAGRREIRDEASVPFAPDWRIVVGFADHGRG